MNPLLRKELRLLLPAWVVTLVVATIPAWSMHIAWCARNADSMAVVSIAFFSLGALFLALTPFGQELSFSTFSMMLVQPERRWRLWWVKMRALGTALVVGFAALCLSWLYGFHLIVRQQDMHWTALLWGCLVLTVVLVSGGLWTTLLFRHVTAAFWFSLIVPAAIFSVLNFPEYQNRETMPPEAEAAILGVYALAGFLLAGWLFLQAQDTPSGSGEMAQPALRGFVSPRFLASAFQQRRNSWVALIYKELQLQQITLLMVVVLALIYLGLPFLAPGSYFSLSLLNSFWMPWLVVPLVIGSVAVAEERRLNTQEGQLCLPARKRSLFGVKLGVVLFLAVLFGGVLPCLLGLLSHGAGARPEPTTLLSMSETFSRSGFERNARLAYFEIFALFAAVPALIAAISFYASTLTRSAIQALGAALLLIVLVFFVVALMASQFQPSAPLNLGLWTSFLGFEPHPYGNPQPIWQGLAWGYFEFRLFLWYELHIHFLAWPAAIATFLWLTYANYRRIQMTQRVWLSNLIGLLTALVLTFIVSNLLYLRPWEYFMRLEPSHGPPRINASMIGRVRMTEPLPQDNLSRTLFVLLPDGRVWTARVERPFSEHATAALRKFVDSSNWIDLDAGALDAVGIQSDHTLWTIDSSGKTTRIGSASDWQAAVAGQGDILALKQDGVLWRSSTNIYYLVPNQTAPGTVSWRAQLRPNFHVTTMTPFGAGAGSNWCGVFSSGGYCYALNRDSNLLRFEPRLFDPRQTGWLSSTDSAGLARLNSERYLPGGTNWSSLVGSAPSVPNSVQLTAAVSADGGLWAEGALPKKLFGRDCPSNSENEPVRIGSNSEWREVSGNSYSCAAVEKSGTLWLQNKYGPSVAEHPSGYSDWLAVNVSGNWVTALAADGTVTIWSPRQRSNLGLPEPRMKPVLSLNIFNAK